MPYTEENIKEINKYNMIPICIFKANEDIAFNIFSSIQIAVSIFTKNSNILLNYYHVSGNVYQLYGYYKKPVGIKINNILEEKLKNFISGYLMGIDN